MRSARLSCLVFVLAVAIGAYAPAALADVPALLNYQGYLTDPDGLPITDSAVAMEFSIWDDESSTDTIHLLWDETWDAGTSLVSVTDGYFAVPLGRYSSLAGLFDATDTLWLEIAVNGVTLLPRKRIATSPYGFVAAVADDISFQVGEAQIASDAITAAKIRTGAVGSSEIATDAVGAAEIGSGEVGTSEVQDGSLTADDLGEKSVGSEEIMPDAVLAVHIANNAVGSGEVIDNSLTASDLAEDSVGASELDTSPGGLNIEDSDSNGGVITIVNTADGSGGNLPAGLMGGASGAPGAYLVVGVAGFAPPLGLGAPTGLIPAGEAIGVVGASDTGPGVVGVSNTDNGVYAESANNHAIYATSNGYDGVRAISTGGSQADNGVYGETDSTTLSEAGVKGVSTDTASGVYGVSSTGHGVYGETGSDTSSDAGVRGYSNGASPGVYGQSAAGYGVRAYATANHGVYAYTADNADYHAVYAAGSVHSTSDISSGYRIYTGSTPPTVVYNSSTYTTSSLDIGSSDDVMVDDDLWIGDNAYIDGTLYGGKGGLATVVETKSGAKRTYHADEATQDMLTDRGSARLAGGEATVFLNPAYADVVRVDASHKLMVQLTPTSECRGLYVSSTTGESFTVRELGGGASDATFDWEVAAQRMKGIQGRMPLAAEALPVVDAD